VRKKGGIKKDTQVEGFIQVRTANFPENEGRGAAASVLEHLQKGKAQNYLRGERRGENTVTT